MRSAFTSARPPPRSGGSQAATRRWKSARPTRIQSSWNARPRTSSASERSPTRLSIGKKNAHWNGQEPRDRLHPVRHQRERDEAAGEKQLECHLKVEDRRPARRPEAEHSEDRLEHRPQEVGTPDRNARRRRSRAGRGSSVGSNTNERPTAIGIQSTMTTTFQPAKYAMSKCSGCIGRSSAPASSPSRIRCSQ